MLASVPASFRIAARLGALSPYFPTVSNMRSIMRSNVCRIADVRLIFDEQTKAHLMSRAHRLT